MKKLIQTVLTLSFLTLLVSPALAWDPGACQADVEKLCKKVKMGEGRIKACLEKHASELSTECKANLFDAAMKKKASEAKKE